MKRIIALFSCLLWLEANAATPSYSNFSSNQFSPSGTYTVTVKNQPLLTNIVEHAQLSLTNPAFANSLVYITNMTGTNGITNGMVYVSTYGKKIQFAWMTNGIGITNAVMVISNGFVGIGKGNPISSVDIAGDVRSIYSTVASGFNFGSVLRSLISPGPTSSGGAVPMVFSSGSVGFTNGSFNVFADGSEFLRATNVWNPTTVTNSIYLQVLTSGVPVMSISNGLVGIGKANPAQALDVVGSVASSGNVQASLNFVGSGTIRAGNGSVIFWNSVGGPGLLNTRGNLDIRSYDGNDAKTNGIISPWVIFPQAAEAYMTDARITNLLAVTAGKTNGMFVNTNGPMVYIWSDGWTVYSKVIAP